MPRARSMSAATSLPQPAGAFLRPVGRSMSRGPLISIFQMIRVGNDVPRTDPGSFHAVRSGARRADHRLARRKTGLPRGLAGHGIEAERRAGESLLPFRNMATGWTLVGVSSSGQPPAAEAEEQHLGRAETDD